jgi:RES domain-containing protein
MRAFRIADRRFPIFDVTGARLGGGRWNSPGGPVIYAAETFAGAVLEVLIHANLGRVPRTHAAVEITIADTIVTEIVAPETVPGWDADDQTLCRAYGDRWLQERRTAVLLVPSLVTCGRERNVLLNPEHPAFEDITSSKPQDVAWNERLFRHRK